MSINAKGIQLFVWRTIRFSGSCCYGFVRRFPDISGFLVFVLVVYLFSPYVFLYCMYSSPVVVFSAFYIRFYLKIKYLKSQMIKKQGSGVRLYADRKNEPSLRHQKSVRRNARKEVVEWDGKYREEKDVLFGTDPPLGDPNTVFANETSKPHVVWDDTFQGSFGTGPGDGAGDGKLVVKHSEEACKAGNKATQDEQKNYMDLGLTELERNRRLQNLIAKRRAKKLFRMAIEKTLMDIHNVPPDQLASVLITKNNNGGVSSNLDEDELPMLGSAPSLLLPKLNSFDLPYDPQEDKPYLTAESFQQEFMADNQKEMCFCRDESSRRRPWFPYPTTQNPKGAEFNLCYSDEKRLVEGKSDKVGHHWLNSSGIENDIDIVELEEPNHNEAINLSEEKKEQIIESLNSRTEIGEKMEKPHDLEPGLDSGSEVRMETDSIKNNDSCYSSSSENTEPVLDQTIKASRIRNDHVQRALKLAIPPKGRAMNRLSFDSSPSPSERRRDFNSFYSRQQCHTPTFSIASDLQVEVSEVGSPPLTTDGTISSVDGDSVIYDGDADRDINSESEQLWGGPFNLAREEANRERVRELDDIIEEESVEVSSISPSEYEAKKILNSTSSLSSRIDITENGACHPTYINRETHQASGKCRHGNLEISYEVRSTIESGKRVEESRPSKHIEEDTRTLTEHNTRDAPNPVQSRDNLKYVPTHINSEAHHGSSNSRHGNLERSYEVKSTIESGKQVKESQPSKYTEEGTRTLTMHYTRGAPNAVQSRGNLKSVPDTIVGQDAAENNILERRLHDSIARALNRRLMPEKVSASSFLSPRSVLQQNILADPIPISGVGRRMKRSLSQSVREDIVRSNFAYEQARERLTANMPYISHEWFENSIYQLTRNRSLGTLEMGPRNFIREDNIAVNINNSVGIGKDKGKKLTANEGESIFLIIPEDISGSEKSNEQEADMNETETIESDYTSIVETAKERENSAAEVDRICKANEPVVDTVTDKRIENDVLEREGALQILGKLEAVIESSNSTGETSAGSVEYTEHESRISTEAEANASQSTSVGETNSLNNNKNDAKLQNLTGQEGVMDASESGEEELEVIKSILNVDSITEGISIDRDISVKVSKLIESEVKAAKMIKYDTGIDSSNSEMDNAKSDDTETLEPTYSPTKVIKEGNIVTSINDLAVIDKEGEKFTTNKGESQISIRQEGIRGPEKLNELEADVNKAEAIENDYTSIVETAKERENSAAEVDRICKANESVAENVTNKETKNVVLEREGALRILVKLESFMEPSNTTGKTSEGSVEDTEHKSTRLAEAEANSRLSTPAGEANSLNSIKSGQEIQNMSHQEGMKDSSQSGEGNLNAIDSIPNVDNITHGTSIDHDIAVKASKPTESEVKATKTDEKDSNAMAG